MKIQNGVAAVIIGGLLIALGCWIIFGDTSLRQSHRMKMARKHLPAISGATSACSCSGSVPIPHEHPTDSVLSKSGVEKAILHETVSRLVNLIRSISPERPGEEPLPYRTSGDF